MFYSNIILTKKGTLGIVWLAAHLNKLSKKQIVQADIEQSVESIVSPPVPLALRVSGHLLLGIVRIYQRKVRYLLNDCNESLAKIKMAFLPGAVDLPADQLVANYNAITLPEHYGDIIDLNFPDAMPELEYDAEVVTVSANVVAHPQDITLRTSVDFDFDLRAAEVTDAFGAGEEQWFEEPATAAVVQQEDMQIDDIEMLRGADVDAGRESEMFPMEMDFDPLSTGGKESVGLSRASGMSMGIPSVLETPMSDLRMSGMGDILIEEEPARPLPAPTRKRKIEILIDSSTELTGDQIRSQLANTDAIVRKHVRAPLTKRQMLRRSEELAGVEALFDSVPFDLADELKSLYAKDMFSPLGVAPTGFSILPKAEEAEVLRAAEEDMARVVEDLLIEPWDVDMPPPHAAEEEQPQFEPFDMQPQELEMMGGPEATEPSPTQQLDFKSFLVDEEEVSASQQPQVQQNKTQKMLELLQASFGPRRPVLHFNSLVKDQSRKNAISCFYQILVLKTKDLVAVAQDEPFGDIKISRTHKMSLEHAMASPSGI